MSVVRTLLLLIVLVYGLGEAGALTREEIAAAMRRAADYYAKQVAVEGGYVYYVSPDLKKRLGEGAATATEIWVQPPGTPTVGEAFLEAWAATRDEAYLGHAMAAGRALVHGQLESGGWRNSIEFDPSGPRVDQYRKGKGRGKNFSTLDDDITQSALRFLMRLDEATGFQNPAIHEAVEYAWSGLLAAQFPNGAFPQGWTGPVGARPIVSANYPDYDWKTEGRVKEYWNEYTLNDGLALTLTDTLLLAHRLYRDDRYLAALKRLGDFFLLARMPDPQLAWAQQYNAKMRPIWARAFEPPAISGRESEDVCLALLKIAEKTGDANYAEAVVPVVKYLDASLLPDGRLARYYELRTNRPLYMSRQGKAYALTHDDSDLPDHYGWKSAPRLEDIKSAYRAHRAGKPIDEVFAPAVPDAATVATIVADLDAEGRWITVHDGRGERLVGQPKFAPGEPYLDSGRFAENLGTVSRYLTSGL